MYGVALLTGGVAGFTGTLIAGPLRRRVDEQAILLTCLAAGGLVCLVAVAAPDTVGMVALAGAVALAATTGRQGFDSLTQRLAPDAEKGRAFAGFEWRFELAWVIGAIIPVTFKPSLPVGLVAVGSVMLAASGVYWFGLRELRGGQLVVPLLATDEDEHLASSILGVARAASAHGAYRMAVSLAHEAAQVCQAQSGNGTAPQELVELIALWRDAAGGAPLDSATATRATELAGRILAAAPRPPASG